MVEIKKLLNSKIPALRIRRPQVERQRNPAAFQAGPELVLSLSIASCRIKRDFAFYFLISMSLVRKIPLISN